MPSSNAARSTSRLVVAVNDDRGDLAFKPNLPMVARPDRAVARLLIRRSGGIPGSQLAPVLHRYGLQVIGRPFAESTALRIGAAYESATDWHRRRAPL